MHSTLKKFNIAFLILNVIGAIVGAIICWVDELVGIGFLTLIGGILYASFIYVILGTIAETGENVEALKSQLNSLEGGLKKEDNTNSSSITDGRAQLFRYDDNNTGRPNRPAPAPTQWKCKFCNRINYSYTGTCACGHTKKESESKA